MGNAGGDGGEYNYTHTPCFLCESFGYLKAKLSTNDLKTLQLQRR